MYVRAIIIIMNIFVSILGNNDDKKLLTIIHKNNTKYIAMSIISARRIDRTFSVVSRVRFLRKWKYESIMIPVISIYPDIMIPIHTSLAINTASISL